jgi:hypothetical protein
VSMGTCVARRGDAILVEAQKAERVADECSGCRARLNDSEFLSLFLAKTIPQTAPVSPRQSEPHGGGYDTRSAHTRAEHQREPFPTGGRPDTTMTY